MRARVADHLQGDVRLETDVFLLPGREPSERIVYAPLRRVALGVNAAGSALVRQLQTGVSMAQLAARERAFVRRLAALGLFDALADRPPPVSPLAGDAYQPTTVTLFLTGRCNLGCGYCYARGGETAALMSWEIAKAAIDFVVANALARGLPEVGVIFHGDGEPTLAWPLLRRCVEYAESECAARDLRCGFEAGMNGIIAEERLRWIAPKLRSMTISLDGPPDVQDAQRPLRSGREGSAPRASSSIVERTLAILDELAAPYGIRCTVTRRSVDRMPEVVEYICGVSRAPQIQMEPIYLVGRAADTGQDAVQPEAFVRGFLAARLVARRYGRRLVYSGARPTLLTNRFCEALSGAFNVTQDGRITSCYEVFAPDDARLRYFGLGGYDRARGTFVADVEKIRAAARWSALEKAPCQTCFAKYHCAGDCSAKLATTGDPADTVDEDRCYVIREITRAQLFSLYDFGDVEEPSQRWPRADGTP
jgi:uncharacterized protein